MPDFEFFEAHSDAMQRKKVEIRGFIFICSSRKDSEQLLRWRDSFAMTEEAKETKP